MTMYVHFYLNSLGFEGITPPLTDKKYYTTPLFRTISYNLMLRLEFVIWYKNITIINKIPPASTPQSLLATAISNNLSQIPNQNIYAKLLQVDKSKSLKSSTKKN